MLIFVMVVLISGTYAAESDPFTFIKQDYKYVDYFPIINNFLGEHIQKCVKGNIRITVLASCLKYFLTLQIKQEFEQKLDSLIEYPMPKLNNTIYACMEKEIEDRKRVSIGKLRWANTFMIKDSNITVYIGTDKIVHMFLGGLLYSTGLLNEKLSRYSESNTVFGMNDLIQQHSYADLYANIKGYEMWNYILEQTKCKPFCEFKSQFHIDSYLDILLDESVNINYIKNNCNINVVPRFYPNLTNCSCKYYHAINPLLNINMSCPLYNVDRF